MSNLDDLIQAEEPIQDVPPWLRPVVEETKAKIRAAFTRGKRIRAKVRIVK